MPFSSIPFTEVSHVGSCILICMQIDVYLINCWNRTLINWSAMIPSKFFEVTVDIFTDLQLSFPKLSIFLNTGLILASFMLTGKCKNITHLLTHHGPATSPASWPHSAARPMAQVYLSACSPRSQWACRGYFPRISGELLSQQCWAVLDCGCWSGSSITINTAHWIVWVRVYLPPFGEDMQVSRRRWVKK